MGGGDAARAAKRPGWAPLFFGVLFPSVVIGVELVTRICAQTSFDPMPTLWHVALVCAVPAINAWLWIEAREAKPVGRWAPVAGGAALAVAAGYSLVFLPLLPLAVLGVLFYGIGLLPFGPVAALLSTGALVRRSSRPDAPVAKRVLGGVLLGLLLMTLLDVPAAATRLGVQMLRSPAAGTQAQGVALLRRLGDRNLLLRWCYDSSGQATGLLSAMVATWSVFDTWDASAPRAATTSEAREAWYRTTGTPFNAVPPPFRGGAWRFADELEFDPDQGGTQVGGRVRGLDLVASRIDGSADGEDAVGYLEWTLEFRNDGAQSAEARLDMALPPGAVVSRATLWVNGEPREAVVAGRAEARAAYEQVVRRERRDPLLVTTRGADRVLVQAFPVPAGGTIKYRIGMTAPLQLAADGTKARLALPAIADRNFSLAKDLRHAVWIEGDGAASAGPGLVSADAGSRSWRLKAAFNDRELTGRPALQVARQATPSTVAAQVGNLLPVRQTIAPVPASPRGAVMLVVDGSAGVKPVLPAVRKALDALPTGAPVGLAVALDEVELLPPAPWSPARRETFLKALEDRRFVGGRDNAPALIAALAALDRHADAELVWIRGPQPVRFHRSAFALEQALDRSPRLPRLTLYAAPDGADQVSPDHPWIWSARSLAGADLGEHLRAAFSTSTRWHVVRAQGQAAGAPTGSEHVARLWAADQALVLAKTDREAALKLAAEHRLVTPLSGAVVLETDADYTRAGLAPPDASDLPTVPEPSEIALLAVVALALAWAAWRARRRTALG